MKCVAACSIVWRKCSKAGRCGGARPGVWCGGGGQIGVWCIFSLITMKSMFKPNSSFFSDSLSVCIFVYALYEFLALNCLSIVNVFR